MGVWGESCTVGNGSCIVYGCPDAESCNNNSVYFALRILVGFVGREEGIPTVVKLGIGVALSGYVEDEFLGRSERLENKNCFWYKLYMQSLQLSLVLCLNQDQGMFLFAGIERLAVFVTSNL